MWVLKAPQLSPFAHATLVGAACDKFIKKRFFVQNGVFYVGFISIATILFFGRSGVTNRSV